jgi:hypothetical protein
VTPHLLVAYNGTTNLSTPSSVVAVNLVTKAIDGTISSADSEAIVDTSNSVAPFLLNQTLDTVVEIQGWSGGGSWTIPANPGDGAPTDDPYAVSVAAGNSLYVVSYASNDIYVYDLGSPGSPPTARIPLALYLQPGDADGFVDATAAVYDAKTGLLYVVLGNINTALTTSGGDTYDYMGSYETLCATTTSSVIAIDTTNNGVVSLQGSAPGGGIALKGYDPSGPQGVVFDTLNNRLLILEAGCNPPPTTDGGAPGAVQQRGVEAVDLTARTSSIVLDASSQGFPGNLVYVSETEAVVSFIYPTNTAFHWNPTETTLGAAIPTAPQSFDYDGNGNLVGANVNYPTTDGGAMTTDIVSVSLATGNVTVLQSNPVTLGDYGLVASVGVWPRP